MCKLPISKAESETSNFRGVAGSEYRFFFATADMTRLKHADKAPHCCLQRVASNCAVPQMASAESVWRYQADVFPAKLWRFVGVRAMSCLGVVLTVKIHQAQTLGRDMT